MRETVVFPAPDGEERMNISPRRWSASLSGTEIRGESGRVELAMPADGDARRPNQDTG
jgi:hypothetical protein